MVKPKKTGVVPKLRFPEFRETEGWEKNNLSAISEVVRGGSPRPIDEYITSDPNGLNWLKIGDVPKDSKYITGTEQRVLRSALSKTREVLPGDFILSNSMSFGRPYLSKIRTCIHDGWIALTALPDSVHRDFLYYLISSGGSQTYFEDQAAGGGVRNLTVEIVKLLPLVIPTSAEQQKIADCLTSLDELITAQGRKVEALKTYKRGLMQQLFPREGETVPRLRFPEFRDAPEWEDKTVGELGDVITGNTPETAKREYYGGEYRFVSPADISEARFVSNTKTTLTEEGFSRSRSIPARSVLFVCIGSTIGKICQNTYECATNQQINSVVACDDVSGDFVYYLLTMAAEQIAELAGRQAVPIINKSLFSSIKLFAPKREEQKRIADGLSALDECIEAESNYFSALKTHKQALMQQLFPAVEEA